MYRQLIAFLLLAFAFCNFADAAVSACPVTVGTITLNVTTPRSACASPCFIFFNATGTTDSATLGGANNTFQDVEYTWNFSDPNSSGKGNWAYGTQGAYSAKNIATGPVVGHLYIVPPGGGDKAYTAIVTANDGTTSATCGVSITAYDPNGANGWPTTATTCVAATTTPVAGSGGCPSGASVLQQSVYDTALGSAGGSSKRVLFKCGDTFTSTTYYHIVGVSKESIGAYGGCEGTQTSRPIFSNQTGSYDSQIQTDMASGDIRIADIDFEGVTSPGGGGAQPNGAVGTDATGFTGAAYQFTLWNLKSWGNSGGYATQQSAQWAIVGSTMANVSDVYIATFMNTQGTLHMPLTTGAVLNQDYMALIGDYFDGPGNGAGSTAGYETVRISYASLAFISNSTFLDANNYGAVLKIHESNGGNDCPATGTGSVSGTTLTVATFTPGIAGDNLIVGAYAIDSSSGVSYGNISSFGTGTGTAGTYTMNTSTASTGSVNLNFYSLCFPYRGYPTQYVVVSDNYFGGTSAAQLEENATAGASDDERLQYFINERNFYNASGSAAGGDQILVNAKYETVRDNVFHMVTTSTNYPLEGALFSNEVAGLQNPQNIEAFNNTCYTPTVQSSQTCISFTPKSGATAASNSIAENNLFFANGAGTNGTVTNSGTGTGTNTIANNTATVTNNPAFTDGSTNFSLITDFKPTANYTGGTSVPNFYDAFGTAWSPTWDLGAIHH